MALIVFAELLRPMPEQLWTEFKEHFMEDYLQRGMSRDLAESRAFYDVVQHLADLGKNYRDVIPLDIPRLEVDIPTNLEDHEARGADKYRSLSAEQKSIVDLVLQTAENRLGGCYFIDGPAVVRPSFTQPSTTWQRQKDLR